jgi:hypothetical protein
LLLIVDIFNLEKRLKRQNKISDEKEKAIMKMRNNSHDLIAFLITKNKEPDDPII